MPVGISLGLIGISGGIVYVASAVGQLLAMDKKTGKALCHMRVGGLINFSPMTYMASGKEFIAITAARWVLRLELPG